MAFHELPLYLGQLFSQTILEDAYMHKFCQITDFNGLIGMSPGGRPARGGLKADLNLF